MSTQPERQAPSILVNYRIADTLPMADRLAADLQRAFGAAAGLRVLTAAEAERAVAEAEQGDIHGRVDHASLEVSKQALGRLSSERSR